MKAMPNAIIYTTFKTEWRIFTIRTLVYFLNIKTMIKKSLDLLFFIQFFIFIGCAPSESDKLSLKPITPESQGISSSAILDFIEAVESERKDEMHGLVILRHGKKISEGYWAPYNPESRHMLFSLSKSFTSSAIGIAQDEGLISINDKVLSFFPDEAPDSISNNLNAMRIRDLLRMNTGHDKDVTWRLRSEDKSWVEAFLSLPVEHKPSTHFVYNSAATFMLSAIIQKVTGETLVEYLTPRLFEPLEINDPRWESNPEGINMGGWGLNVRTRDIANFGQLYLQKGNWQGDQLISEDWVEEATSFQTANGSNPDSDWDQGYGYQFWRCRHNLYRGDGAFGQYCIVMPEQDAVVAINSGTTDMQAIMNLVWEYLLPAFQDKPLPENEEDYQALKNKLSGLSLSFIEGKESSPMAEKVSNRSYVLEPNMFDIKSFLFEFSDKGNNITFISEEESLKIPVGFGSAKKGTMLIPQYGKQPVASTGAWITNSTFEVRMYYYETPFFLTLDFIFADDVVTMDSRMNVGFGPGDYPQLKGKAE
jgi:CubicO group peptidase (beta-lactamase class C family)